MARKGPRPVDPAVRFWRFVVVKGPEECWPWTGRLNAARGGYGQFNVTAGEAWSAHRYAFFLTHGYVPKRIRHTCDIQKCVNASHLLPGTNPRKRAERAPQAKSPAPSKPRRSDPIARFWSKVDIKGPDECWPFIGRCNHQRGGYGQFDDEHRHTWRAHRYAFFVTHGYAPILVRHTCDRPLCVNPQHLLEGTAQQNMDDMKARGRDPIGERHGRHKLSEEDVRRIRVLPGTQTAIATLFGISRSAVGLIRNGTNWAHLK